jgi:hypothetical protein
MAIKRTRKKEKDEELREVPLKNYMILLVICLIVIGIAVSLSAAYTRVKNEELTKPILVGSIPEVGVDNLDNYIIENDSFYLFVSSITDYNSREVEKDLLEYFKRNDISKRMVYLSVDNIKDLDSFYEDFNKKYSVFEYAKLKAYPAFIIIKDGKILNLVQKEEKIKLGIGDIDRLLDEYK